MPKDLDKCCSLFKLKEIFKLKHTKILELFAKFEVSGEINDAVDIEIKDILRDLYLISCLMNRDDGFTNACYSETMGMGSRYNNVIKK